MRTPKSWSLRRQLVVGVSAVVMIALATIGTLSVFTLRDRKSVV